MGIAKTAAKMKSYIRSVMVLCAVVVLKSTQRQGQIPLLEVALYGAQIHVVLPEAKEYKEAIRNILLQNKIEVTSLDWIAPTLEDVFISSVTSSSPID